MFQEKVKMETSPQETSRIKTIVIRTTADEEQRRLENPDITNLDVSSRVHSLSDHLNKLKIGTARLPGDLKMFSYCVLSEKLWETNLQIMLEKLIKYTLSYFSFLDSRFERASTQSRDFFCIYRSKSYDDWKDSIELYITEFNSHKEFFQEFYKEHLELNQQLHTFLENIECENLEEPTEEPGSSWTGFFNCGKVSSTLSSCINFFSFFGKADTSTEDSDTSSLLTDNNIETSEVTIKDLKESLQGIADGILSWLSFFNYIYEEEINSLESENDIEKHFHLISPISTKISSNIERIRAVFPVVVADVRSIPKRKNEQFRDEPNVDVIVTSD